MSTRPKPPVSAPSTCRSGSSQAERDCSSWAPTTRLGYVRYLQERYDEALTAYERQVAVLASSGHALKERLIELNQKIGATYLRLGRRHEAELHFDRAVGAYESRLARGANDPFTTYYIAALWVLRRDATKRWRRWNAPSTSSARSIVTRARTDPDFDPSGPIRAFSRWWMAPGCRLPSPCRAQRRPDRTASPVECRATFTTGSSPPVLC